MGKAKFFLTNVTLFSPIGLFFLTIGSVGLYFLWKKSEKNKYKRKTEKTVKHAIKPNKLRYDKAHYVLWANRIQEAYNGWSENENVIEEILMKLKTPSDWYALYDAFGKREIKVPMWFNEEHDLITLLTKYGGYKKARQILLDIGVSI